MEEIKKVNADNYKEHKKIIDKGWLSLMDEPKHEERCNIRFCSRKFMHKVGSNYAKYKFCNEHFKEWKARGIECNDPKCAEDSEVVEKSHKGNEYHYCKSHYYEHKIMFLKDLRDQTNEALIKLLKEQREWEQRYKGERNGRK